MTQIEMFGANIYFILAILLLLVVGSVVLVVVWTGLRVWWFHAQQRRAQQVYRVRTRRADGKMYPPIAVGFCEACGRASKAIYHLTSGETLCLPCYEVFWREQESASAAEDELQADRTA